MRGSVRRVLSEVSQGGGGNGNLPRAEEASCACGGFVYVVSGCGETPAGLARDALGREGWGPKDSGLSCLEGLGGRAPRAGGREGRGCGGA